MKQEIKMEKLNKSFFERNSEEVAKELLGKYLIMTSDDKLIKVKLTEIGAYEGITKTSPKELYYEPGILFITKKFNQNLLDISTNKKDNPSCVTLRGCEIQLENRIERINGPGNLAKTLGINENNKNHYNLQKVYEGLIWFEDYFDAKSQIKQLKPNSPNCKGIYKI